MKTIIFATTNAYKVEEIQVLLPDDITIKSLKDIGFDQELPETQTELEANALQKADALYEQIKQECFADDTGLEIDALDGAPGVYSARYAGEERNDDENMRKVLTQLAGQPNRQAQFRTVIAYKNGEETVTLQGILKGRIAEEPKGENGFGYDPIFIPEGQERTLAEMSLSEKNAISHRGIAINRLVDYLNR